MSNDVNISKFKYLSTIVYPGKYFTGYDAVHVIALDFVHKFIDARIDYKHLKTSNYIRYSSNITVITADDIESEYKISFKIDILNPNNINIIAFSTKNDNIRYHYNNGNVYAMYDTIEDEFLDEYDLMRDIVKEIVNSLKTLTKTFVQFIFSPDIFTNKYAFDFEE